MAIRGSGGLGSGALSIITLKQYGFSLDTSIGLVARDQILFVLDLRSQDPLSASGALTLDKTGWVI